MSYLSVCDLLQECLYNFYNFQFDSRHFKEHCSHYDNDRENTNAEEC